LGCSLPAFTYVNKGHLKVNTESKAVCLWSLLQNAISIKI